MLEEEESGLLLYLILDPYKTGAWKEKIAKMYQSKLFHFNVIVDIKCRSSPVIFTSAWTQKAEV
jgi:hypothetical protein